ITWSRVFTKLDCVDSRMYLALGYDLTADRHRKHVPDFLETAKKCKQALENDLQEAAATPTPTPSRPTPAAGTPAPTPTAAQPSPTTAATPAPTTTAGQPTPMTTPSGGKPQGGPLGATLSPPNTSYAVSFTDPDGGSLTYDWSESSISCGTFTPGTASPDDDIPDNNARWSHPNGTGVGQCPHDQGTSHTGSIVVEVFDEDGHIVRCTYSGSESGQGPPCEEI
ncbi:MAG TPA: hypothetical protein VNC78_08180, partial [Actinomycetota bacterium]|nr:hypothetical protein [Actinomycetota bacterium]